LHKSSKDFPTTFKRKMAEAENKAPKVWNTQMQIVMGPPDNHVFKVGETATFKIAALCQNISPNAITQLFFYVGQPGKKKQVFKVFDGCPGRNPEVIMHDFKYKIPAWEWQSKHHGMLLEFGWGQEMQYTWADAMANFARKGYKDNWMYTMSIAPPQDKKQSFLFDLCTPLPTRAVAGDTIVIDSSYRTQNHYPNAISQALIYYRDEKGDCDIVRLEDHVPGTNPPMKRGGLTYRVPECTVGQVLEVGVYFDLQFTYKDAVANFKKNGPSFVLGKIKIIAHDSEDAVKTRLANLQRHAANFTPGYTRMALPHPKLESKILALFAVDENGDSKAKSWFEDNWDTPWYNEIPKKFEQQVGIAPSKLGFNVGTRFGVNKLVATRATRIGLAMAETQSQRNLVLAPGYGYEALRRLQAEMGVRVGPEVVPGAFGSFLLKMTNPALMVTMPGELIGSAFGQWVDGGKHWEAKEVGGLGGSVAAGIAMGWWLPGIGIPAGAAAGVVSYGIGAGIRAIGHAFHLW